MSRTKSALGVRRRVASTSELCAAAPKRRFDPRWVRDVRDVVISPGRQVAVVTLTCDHWYVYHTLVEWAPDEWRPGLLWADTVPGWFVCDRCREVGQ